jgi:hypothetical protein
MGLHNCRNQALARFDRTMSANGDFSSTETLCALPHFWILSGVAQKGRFHQLEKLVQDAGGTVRFQGNESVDFAA